MSDWSTTKEKSKVALNLSSVNPKFKSHRLKVRKTKIFVFDEISKRLVIKSIWI